MLAFCHSDYTMTNQANAAKQTILAKIQKLLNLSKGTNSRDEAATAAAQAARLMAEHDLAQADLDTHVEAEDTTVEHADLLVASALPTWKYAIANIVGQHFGVFVVQAKVRTVHSKTGRPCIRQTLRALGAPTDLIAHRYLYTFLVTEIDRLCDLEGKGMGRTWRNNFRLGAVEVIDLRLKEQRAVMVFEARTGAADSRALARIDTALTRPMRARALARNTLGRLRTAGKASRRDDDGRAAGHAAGARIPLGAARGALAAG